MTDARPTQPSAGPYQNPGPAKAAAVPHGTGALGNEVGATNDLNRDLKGAAKEGDQGAKSALQSGAGQPPKVGVPSGYDQGIKPPSQGEREKDLDVRTKEAHSKVPDLRTLARTSAGAQAGAPGAETSTYDQDPQNVLVDASTSTGQDSGTGAFQKGPTDIAGAPSRN